MEEIVASLGVHTHDIEMIRGLLSDGHGYRSEKIWNDCVIGTYSEDGDEYYFDLRVVSEDDRRDDEEKEVYDVFIELVVTDENGDEVISSDFVYGWTEEITVYCGHVDKQFTLTIVEIK